MTLWYTFKRSSSYVNSFIVKINLDQKMHDVGDCANILRKHTMTAK